MEACSIICDNNKELDILREVLDILCEISLALSDLNLKSMSNNWKGYMAIVLKFAGVLKEVIFLGTAVKSLKYQIVQNLASLDVSEPIEEKSAAKILTITGFLIKVALKLLDSFWNDNERSCNQELQLCLTISSYPPDLFRTIGYSDDLVNLMKTNVVVPIEQLAQKMYSEFESHTILSSCGQCCEEAPLGVLLFLNNYLGYILENSNQSVIKNTRMDEVIRLIFHCLSLCTYELHFTTAKEIIYDKLNINISASVLTADNLYMKTEEILLRNVLQENIFCALLAVDVWDLVLLNTNAQFQLETIEKLIKVHGQLDFGINTYRPEASHFKFLLRRLFRNLSNPIKLLLTQTNTLQESTDLWKVIGIKSFPEQQAHFVAELCSETIKKVQIMDCDQFGLRDLVCVGENLEILSTVNLSSLPVEQMRSLVSIIGILWSVTFNDFSNNMLRYLIVKLLRITATLITEFNVDQLFGILNTLKILSAQDDLKIAVCNVLKAFAEKNSNELGQDAYKIFTLVSHVIYPHLLNHSNTVVKQYVLEVIDLYYQRNKPDIIRELMKSSKENQEELTSYLERKVVHSPFEKAYFVSLSKQRYKHSCVLWRIVNQPAKKFKPEFAESAPKVERSIKLKQIKEHPQRKVPETNPQEEIVLMMLEML
nr:unnamed protein product [Callosobruchus chinensis]